MTKEQLKEKEENYSREVLESEDFKMQQSYLRDLSFDFINTIREMDIYSGRAPEVYDKQIINSGFDDLIQSAMGVLSLVNEGIHNIARRELRYSLEMVTKYLIVDQERPNDNLDARVEYLKTNIPRSSIVVIDRARLSFDTPTTAEFKAEVKSAFAELSGFVHPSKEQLDMQLANYAKGNYIGFESTESVTRTNKTIFRVYDLILTILFAGFGDSMSGDLFTEIYDHNKEWKFHKGKYVSKYSSLFDYKAERKDTKNR